MESFPNAYNVDAGVQSYDVNTITVQTKQKYRT